ncbi:MAG: FtsQ-type POTRA domain-containing protein [Mogibacterium diversum]|jgi:polypeptide-transport-associated domain protein, ftsQ-type|uniref:cell division protein FtsQ/DivIB n=1 Tax=Mogibacterium diversum TaxID=114527 RepID=UPI0017F1C259|nr:FtsQ-type POTRA domain-containing protein [Mogibacterium diversum]MBB1548038.1 FtsQ-type POTRA domain-containing protein [Mogibacterium sp.]MBF1328482.1 FtsQ-type POTRA domain-containing protein [Mogibacterium diversum]MBF1338043.1 FtsQ-type POTRA domain-containing protein [Mogibacterium diversum]MBF1341155.1 FtsQ-type POTRA domain-containing protein [Mogibacterium diversum]
MKKDKSTKPELSKEEYLKSLFNGAKDELEAYIVSNDQLAADEEPEQADKEDEKSENKNEADIQNGLEIDSELGTPSVSNTNNGTDTPENFDNDGSDNNQSLEDTSLERETSDAGVSQNNGNEKTDEKASNVNEEIESPADRKTKSDIDDIEKRRMKRKRKLKMPGFFTRIFIILGVIIAVTAFSLSSFFTVDTIDVQGNKYFTDEEISNMAHASTGQNIIYKLNKGNMLNYLEKNPYIEEARVYRKLPSTIVINVKERIQIAALTYGDQFLIIDNKGTLLRITKTKPKLTIVTGFKVKKVKLGEPVEVNSPDLFKELLSLLKSMEAGDVYFTKINITELFITANVYDSLVVKSKYKDLKDNIDKGRLHKVLDELFKRNIKRGTITISSDGYASFTPEL